MTLILNTAIGLLLVTGGLLGLTLPFNRARRRGSQIGQVGASVIVARVAMTAKVQNEAG